jgi:uncharacterized protein YlxW (UPF0749 family)
MSLLAQLENRSLDEGYAEAAAARGSDEPPRAGAVLAVGLLAVGLLLATAGAQARDRAPVVAEARRALMEKVTERTAEADRLAAEVSSLQAGVAKARQDRLRTSTSGSQLARELAALEAWTGAAPIVGPAVVVHLEDASKQDDVAASAEDRRASNEIEEGKLTDRDLQTIVNEMWLAGAEAVAVNGQRLTALSAIRAAGPNILVAFRPLNPPYDVVAIGHGPSLRAELAEGFAGSYLDVLRNYGIRSSVSTVRSVRLPASAGIRLRHAQVDGGEATP